MVSNMNLPEWIKSEQGYTPSHDKEYFLARSLLKIAGILSRYKISSQTEIHGRLKPSPMAAMLAWLFTIIICALSHHSILLHSICCLLLWLMCLYQGRIIWKILKPAVLLAVFTFLLILPALLMGGNPLLPLLPYKCFISLLATGIFIHSYTFRQITCTLSWLHLPQIFIFILDTTLRYIYLLGNIAQDSLASLRLRSIGRNPHKSHITVNILGTVYLKSQQMSTEMYQAMVCRGFTGKYPHRHQQPFCLADILPAMICIMLAMLYIYLQNTNINN